MKTLENQLCPLPVDTSAFAGVLIATGRGFFFFRRHHAVG
jgi:hypothetical protein